MSTIKNTGEPTAHGVGASLSASVIAPSPAADIASPVQSIRRLASGS